MLEDPSTGDRLRIGMVEDDHKLIVETETVEAPVSSLLMASTGTGNNGAGGNVNGAKVQLKDALEHGVPPAAIKTVAANSLGSKNDAGLLKKNYSVLPAGASSVAHDGLTGSGSNINLIDNNPLSPHISQASVRNKKSSLLIDSANDKTAEGDDVPKGRGMEGDKTLRKHMEEIANANRDDVESKTNGETEHNVSRSAQSSKTSTTVPTPLMLPVATHAIAGAIVPPTSTVSATTGTQANRPTETKPSKIIERPPITATNSRDVLLDDEVRKKAVNGTTTGGVNANADLALKKSSTVHSEDIHHDLDSLQKPTKADFFAARLASAVGENEISDSEETFIYESAANSTKNAIAPPAFDQHNDHSQQLQHGIASKMSVPVLNNNAKLLSRLKNTRHTSMSALPISASTKHLANDIANRNESLVTSTPVPNPTSSAPNDDAASTKSSDHLNGAKVNDLQSVKSVHSEMRSPDKRLSLTSMGKMNPTGNLLNNATKNGHTSRKPSVSNSTLRHVSSTQAGTARGKFVTKPDGDNNKRNLRTTASKIFDANGAPLRRYSGVPDDVNLEDFIEQSNGHYMTNPSNQRDDRTRNFLENNHNNDKRFSRDMTEPYNRSAIQEEEGENDRDEDDLRSMFYYNHRGDLEARPQISDYEEDGEGIDDDNHDDKYYNGSFRNGYNGNGSANYDNGRPTRLLESQFSPSDMHFAPHNFNQPNPNGAQNAQYNSNANEQTPLRIRKPLSRNQLSYSPHNFYTRKSSWAKIRHCVYFTFIVISLLTVVFILGFLLATNKELQGFNIVIMDNILSSSDELLFDITVTAFNPGFFAIGVQDVNLDIFAKSSHIPKTMMLESGSNTSPSRETILLGTVCSLETPLKFEGGFLKRSYDVSVSTVKLLDPGSKADNPDDDEGKKGDSQKKDDVAKWKSLIQHEYELIVRGSMQYKIPFFRSNKSIAVQSSADVHPGKDGDEEYNKFLLL